MKNYRLNETKIGSATVVVDILPKGRVIPNAAMTPTSITIHNTGNIGAPAKNNHNYMKNCNKNGSRIASWHFTVDDTHIYQAIPTNRKAYHAGCASGNNTSIGIEICMFNDAARQKKCYENAIALVKILMKYHNFTTSKIKKHYDWTKKDCPTWLRSGKFGYTWSWFINKCAGTASSSTPAPSTSVKVPYTAKIIVDELNVRKGPGTSYEVATVVKKGQSFTITEEKDGWGKLKSGAGWINLDKAYVQKI